MCDVCACFVLVLLELSAAFSLVWWPLSSSLDTLSAVLWSEVHQQLYLRQIITAGLVVCANDTPLLLGRTVQCDAVLLSDGGQLFQELGEQDDGEHSALGLWGNRRARRQDTERRQSQSVPHRAIRKRWVQDDVAALRLQALCDTWGNVIRNVTCTGISMLVRSSGSESSFIYIFLMTDLGKLHPTFLTFRNWQSDKHAHLMQWFMMLTTTSWMPITRNCQPMMCCYPHLHSSLDLVLL